MQLNILYLIITEFVFDVNCALEILFVMRPTNFLNQLRWQPVIPSYDCVKQIKKKMNHGLYVFGNILSLKNPRKQTVINSV